MNIGAQFGVSPDVSGSTTSARPTVGPEPSPTRWAERPFSAGVTRYEWSADASRTHTQGHDPHPYLDYRHDFYDEARIEERMRLAQIAIDARRRHRPEEAPCRYAPFLGREEVAR